MKKKGLIFLALAVAIATLFLPAVKIYVHSQLGAETAALYPQTVSLWDMAVRPAAGLPVDSISALGLIRLDGWMLLAGLGLMAVGAALPFIRKKGCMHASLAVTCAALGLLATFTLQVVNVSGSLLFTMLLDEVQVFTYIPAVACLVQLVVLAVWMKGGEPLGVSDVVWRRLGGVLALLTALCMLLPGHVVTVPDTVTASPADAAAMNGTLSILQEMTGKEPNLAALAKDKGVFAEVLTGDLAVLEPYSADANNIRGIFTITTSTASMNAYLVGALALLLLSALLSFLPRVDRWFPLVCGALALVLVGASVTGMLTVSDTDMFSTATRQLCKLGVGRITAFPALMLLVCLGSVMCGVLGVRAANEPYFVNPIPQRSRMRAAALFLAVAALAMVLLPGASFSFTKPGKNKVLSTVSMSGWQAMVFKTPEDILSPKDNKGKPIYAEEAGEGELNAQNAADTMSGITRAYGVTVWAALLLIVLGVAMLLRHADKRWPILLFLAAFAVRIGSWLIVSLQMPKVMGSASGTLYLYISLPLLVFAAFFSNFAHMEELPKKYKLFLMMLPFLLAVFLFSYLPLYGWSYAFYNYKFGIPMSEQEFVGLKWFTEMFTNQGHRDNIVRVLKNTFGMSGLNLVTSWLPMVFAIFLNEITHVRFKKCVQVFTTLPNFISWALVFSFAMALFAMDTGIFSKFMLAVGAIDQPVAWLNSSEHIWLKMWGWSTWKGLGWGAIMYLAAIAGIDQELYEAAKVDGANRWKQMRYITLPGLLPTFFVLLMLSISNILNNGMEQYMVFQNSMNKNTIEVLDLYVYNITIASKGTTLYSFGTAIGILKTLVSVTLLFSANFASKKLRGESIM